jgi:hypothetical protein
VEILNTRKYLRWISCTAYYFLPTPAYYSIEGFNDRFVTELPVRFNLSEDPIKLTFCLVLVLGDSVTAWFYF